MCAASEVIQRSESTTLVTSMNRPAELETQLLLAYQQQLMSYETYQQLCARLGVADHSLLRPKAEESNPPLSDQREGLTDSLASLRMLRSQVEAKPAAAIKPRKLYG